jgi:SPP1 family predicted phage head-tail adaptor
MYQAGRLNRRITIQHIVGNTPDEVGEPAAEWADLATVSAELMVQNGSETFQTQQRTAKQERVFRIRWREGLTPDMRIVYRGQIHEILDIAETDAGAYHELLDIRTYVREANAGGA